MVPVTSETVTVCSACLRASCWQGGAFCGESLGAGTVEKTIDELRALDLEPSYWWDIDPNTGMRGRRRVA